MEDIVGRKHSKSWILTENKIKTAAIELLKEYRMNEMSISAICSKAQIPRSSFYSHYPNTTALFASIENENLDLIKKKTLEFNIISGEKSNTIIPFLNHIKANKSLFEYVLSSFDYDYTNNTIQTKAIKYIKADKDYDAIKTQYKLIALHSALISCLRYWVENGCSESPEMISEILYECGIRNISDDIRYNKPKKKV